MYQHVSLFRTVPIPFSFTSLRAAPACSRVRGADVTRNRRGTSGIHCWFHTTEQHRSNPLRCGRSSPYSLLSDRHHPPCQRPVFHWRAARASHYGRRTSCAWLPSARLLRLIDMRLPRAHRAREWSVHTWCSARAGDDGRRTSRPRLRLLSGGGGHASQRAAHWRTHRRGHNRALAAHACGGHCGGSPLALDAEAVA